MATEFSRHITSPKRIRQPNGQGSWPQRVVAFLLGSEPGRGDQRESSATVAFDMAEEPVERIPPRFRIVRQGYDRLAVDECLRELEAELAQVDRQLAEAQHRTDSADAVQTELERIGEQTSGVLIAAYDQRDGILRAAREEAESSLAEAAAKTSSLVAEREARLLELEAQNEAARRERDRLLDEVRAVSSGLAAVVESVSRRAAGAGTQSA